MLGFVFYKEMDWYGQHLCIYKEGEEGTEGGELRSDGWKLETVVKTLNVLIDYPTLGHNLKTLWGRFPISAKSIKTLKLNNN